MLMDAKRYFFNIILFVLCMVVATIFLSHNLSIEVCTTVAFFLVWASDTATYGNK